MLAARSRQPEPRRKGNSMKFLTSAFALGFVVASVPAAEAATCNPHQASCHVVVVHHVHHYHHYASGGYPPTGYYPPPPGYATFDQPLASAGVILGDPDWRDRNTLKLLMDNIGDTPYDR
jgi:hypothetical protein